LALNYFSFAVFSSFRALFANWGDFDIILVYQLSPITVGVPARILKWRSGSKLILWIQDLWPESVVAAGEIRSAGIKNAVEMITRWIYRRCDRILVQSRAFKTSVTQRGVDPDRIRYLPNFAEEIFDGCPEVTLGRDSSKPNKFKIMFAGNIGAAQDFRTIVEAAELTRKHTGIQWLIVGDGRQKAWLTKEISERRLDNVLMLGRYPKVEMPGVLAKANILLVSLKKDPLFALTIPSKVQAYLACGKPILGSLNGEGARVIDEARAGVSVAAENPDLLASTAVELSRLDQEQLRTMGRNARRYYKEKFAKAHIMDEFEKVISEVVAESCSHILPERRDSVRTPRG
jgi:glycosyltransferase involved in cell wall biosynthesis